MRDSRHKGCVIYASCGRQKARQQAPCATGLVVLMAACKIPTRLVITPRANTHLSGMSCHLSRVLMLVSSVLRLLPPVSCLSSCNGTVLRAEWQILVTLCLRFASMSPSYLARRSCQVATHLASRIRTALALADICTDRRQVRT